MELCISSYIVRIFLVFTLWFICKDFLWWGYMCTCIHLSVFVCRPEANIGIFHNLALPCLLRQHFSLNTVLLSWLDWVASKLWWSKCFYPQSMTDVSDHAFRYHESKVRSSCLHIDCFTNRTILSIKMVAKFKSMWF